MQCNRRQYNTCNTKKYHVIPYLSRLTPQLGQKGYILAHGVCFWPFSQARSKWVVAMSPTHAGSLDQIWSPGALRGPPRSGAVGTKSDPLEPSEGPTRGILGQKGPFLPVFDRFLELGGSKWAITVLDEQGIPLRCCGYPTSLYLKQKMSVLVGLVVRKCHFDVTACAEARRLAAGTF